MLLLALLLVGCLNAPSPGGEAPISALDTRRGVTIWTSPPGSDPSLASLVGCLVVGEKLVGVDLKSGRQLWQIERPPHRVLLQGDLLLLYDGSALSCQDARGPGTVRWSVTVLRDMLPVDLQDGVLVLRGKNGLSALEAASGRELWHQAGDYGDACVRAGRVFAVRTGSATLEAFQLAGGQSLWTATLSGVVFGLVAADDGSVAVRTSAKALESYAAENGRLLFRLETELDLAGGNESLLVLAGAKASRVIRATDGKLICEIEAGLARRVVLQDGRLFSLVGEFGSLQLKAFDAASGREVWVRNCASRTATGDFPRYAGGHLIAPFEVRP